MKIYVLISKFDHTFKLACIIQTTFPTKFIRLDIEQNACGVQTQIDAVEISGILASMK